jgi:hypothetical protein
MILFKRKNKIISEILIIIIKILLLKSHQFNLLKKYHVLNIFISNRNLWLKTYKK